MSDGLRAQWNIAFCPECGPDADVEKYEWHGDLWIRCWACKWNGTIQEALERMEEGDD